MGAGPKKPVSEPVTFTPASVISQNADWLTAQIGEDLVMMNSVNGRHIGLTETGRRIWEILETPSTIGQICTVLAGEYAAEADEMAPDVESFLQDLASLGAVAVK
ncbi:MAG TPA: PqqD family protein [Rhizomicrobium sp.]|jgi:hypothetical protein|nr:PqqD family protein [Rhizomicrobium sp.]